MRVSVDKTYKLFIGGKFVRSESGRVYQSAGAPRTNVSQASRKDLRDAVSAAHGALGGWSSRTAYNRGQILYRIAEMLENRKQAMVEEIVACTVLDAPAADKGSGCRDRSVHVVCGSAGQVDAVAWFAERRERTVLQLFHR